MKGKHYIQNIMLNYCNWIDRRTRRLSRSPSWRPESYPYIHEELSTSGCPGRNLRSRAYPTMSEQKGHYDRKPKDMMILPASRPSTPPSNMNGSKAKLVDGVVGYVPR